jgi:hypothetical protein
LFVFTASVGMDQILSPLPFLKSEWPLSFLTSPYPFCDG